MDNNRYQVKFTNTTSGWDGGERGRKYLDTETLYDIDWIDIHSMHTRIYLVGFKDWFNSVYFTFYKNGEPVDECDVWEFYREFGANVGDYEYAEDDED